jgi:hypothetical protein
LTPGQEGGHKSPEFEEVLKRSIEDGLREILGQSGLQMLLSHFPLNRLPTDPVVFHETLKGIFMENGASVIEREIARRLLDRMGGERPGEGRLHRWWLATAAALSAERPGEASASEKKVLRQFMTLSSLPKGHLTSPGLRGTGGAITASSLELTSMRFASAFKKGI